MSILSAVIQGLIQGFTEFLPVSSSGHLSLYQYFTGISSEESVAFSIILHLGTFFAVVVAFWPTVLRLIIEVVLFLRDLFTGRLLKEPPSAYRRMLYLLFLSCIPLLIVLPLQDVISGFSSDNSIVAEGIFFLCTALLLTLGDRCRRGKKKARSMTVKDAFAIGFAQLFATLPGVSRSGSTISAGMLVGLDHSYAVTYSFILGLPAILAAALLDLKDIIGSAEFGLAAGPAVIGMLVSAVSGFFAIKLVAYIVKSDKFRIFAIYTCILGIVMLAIGISEHFTDHAVQSLISSMIH